MSSLLLALLLQLGASATQPDNLSACARDVQATDTATTLADLPADVRQELTRFEREFMRGRMADSHEPLLQTDAPGPEERNYPTVRFAHALLVRDQWFVQYEVALMAGVQTIDFYRGPNGRFQLSLSHFFGGPACASIKAALAGVRTPGGFPAMSRQPYGALIPVGPSSDLAPRD